MQSHCAARRPGRALPVPTARIGTCFLKTVVQVCRAKCSCRCPPVALLRQGYLLALRSDHGASSMHENVLAPAADSDWDTAPIGT